LEHSRSEPPPLGPGLAWWAERQFWRRVQA
jgi:hypothetical protein